MKHAMLLMAAVAVAGLAGCGREESAGPPPAPPTTPTPAAPAPYTPGPGKLSQADLDAVTKSTKPFKLALIVKTRNNPFFVPMIRSATEEAKALGVEIEIQAPPQETDTERQFGIVQDVTARGVDAILIAPADSKSIVPALKQAQDKGRLIVNLDNQIDPGTASAAGLKPAAYVGADNEEGGRQAGLALAEALKSHGKVALLEGIRGVDNAEKRKRGFEGAVTEKLEVVARESAEWDTEKAYAKFQSMLAKNADLSGLFCANDKMALGAIKAISEAGKKGKITVVGYDNIPDVQPYLQSGEMYATIEQHPDLMGKYGVRAAVGILAGSVPKGREFLVPLEVIRRKK